MTAAPSDILAHLTPEDKHLLMVKRAGSSPRLILVHNWLREVDARISRKSLP